ncbi:MAG: 5-formyltetrahydrofolate cyclo-ligase [Thermofilaceae archaeon]
MVNSAEKMKFRISVWEKLRHVAKPDSRFHYDFSHFIPDFEGSELCVEKVREMSLYKRSRLLFITPDNCLEQLREAAIIDGKTFVMPTYGIRRGFILLERRLVPHGKEDFAASLDGAERFGVRVSLRDIASLGKFDMVFTGVSLVNTSGVRFGKGEGFFDLEWGMLSEIGVVDDMTPVVVIAHDVQVIEANLPVEPHDTVADIIVTPSRVIFTGSKMKKPKGINWALVTKEMLEEIPPLRELAEMKGIKIEK